MQKLPEMQFRFMRTLFNPDEDDFYQHMACSRLSNRKRLDVYRNNVFGNFRDALRSAYPVVLRLVGDDFFEHMASEFIRGFPSESGDLHDFGQEFPRFISDFQPVSTLPYLSDVARLDWAFHEVFFAPDPAPFPFERLRQIPEDQYDCLKFELSPVCRLISSKFPIHKIWEANQMENSNPDQIGLEEGTILLLVKRIGFSIHLIPLKQSDWAFLSLLGENHRLGLVYESIHKDNLDFDLSATLKRFIVDSVLTGFSL